MRRTTAVDHAIVTATTTTTAAPTRIATSTNMVHAPTLAFNLVDRLYEHGVACQSGGGEGQWIN